MSTEEVIKTFNILHEYNGIIHKRLYTEEELTPEEFHFLVVDFPELMRMALSELDEVKLKDLGIQIKDEKTGCWILDEDEIPF